jgi:hypothetical protein
MSFETISLLLNWIEMGVLLAILFRLSYTFELIANTQRELRRAIYHLGERRATELGINSGFDRFARRAPAHSERTIDVDDLVREAR